MKRRRNGVAEEIRPIDGMHLGAAEERLEDSIVRPYEPMAVELASQGPTGASYPRVDDRQVDRTARERLPALLDEERGGGYVKRGDGIREIDDLGSRRPAVQHPLHLAWVARVGPEVGGQRDDHGQRGGATALRTAWS